VRKRGLSSSEKCSLGSDPTQNEPPGKSDIPLGQLGGASLAVALGGALSAGGALADTEPLAALTVSAGSGWAGRALHAATHQSPNTQARA